MTDDEQVIKEAEDILKGLQDAMDKEQSEEHQRAMPHFRKMGQQLIAEAGKAHCAAHLFLIKGDKATDPDTLPNPLGVEGDDRMGAEFQLTHSFPSYDQARRSLTRPEAAVVTNEARKRAPFAFFLMTRDNLCVCYAAHKLTVSRAELGDHMSTNHIDITKGTEPDEFFTKCGVNASETELVKALMMLAEAGRLMEKETPAIYQVMAKRITDLTSDGDNSEEG